jgi:DNA-binding response OmpR family regulator
MRLLIVEDDIMIAESMQDVAIEAGHDVVGLAHRSGVALSLAQTALPDLALVDMHLSNGESGAEVAHLMRVLFGIPSMFVSGNPSDCRNAAKLTRALGCLSKPFVDAELAAALSFAQAVLDCETPNSAPLNFEGYATDIG